MLSESLNRSLRNITPELTSSSKSNQPSDQTPDNILTTVIGGTAVILNGLLLVAMLRNSSNIFTSHGAYLVANVAIADLLTGLNSSFWGIKKILIFPVSVNTALFSIFWTTVEASFFTIFIMSLERWIAILYPFKASLWLSKSRTIQSIVLAWILSGLCGLWVSYYPESAMQFLATVFEITILVTCFLYYKIFMKLGQRRTCLPLQFNDNQRNNDLKREYQLTTAVLVLIFILIVTVLPYMIAGQLSLSLNEKDHPNLHLFTKYYMPVELTNFVLNPIVYAIRLPKYRYAILRTMRCC